MDSRPDERARGAVHGLVNGPSAASSSAVRRVLTAGFVLLVAVSLVSGVAGGLLRAGVPLGFAAETAWLPQAAALHAALMIGSFFGTVIGIERAVALKHAAAFLAPLASGTGGALLLAGQVFAGAWIIVLASVVFVAANALVVRRQRAVHTVLLLFAACAWLVGNVQFALGRTAEPTYAWWFAFLVMTIAAERLEMTRLLPRRPGAQAFLFALIALLLAGAGAAASFPAIGSAMYGLALAALAFWLARFDIARRTLRAEGLSRYMAVCLLSGYAWLALAGCAWSAGALGFATRDMALHALGLGFIFSMVMGHAPVILPAVARIKVSFSSALYVPLALLHVSLALRLAAGFDDPALRAFGAALNAAAIVLFAATMVGCALRGRAQTRTA
ncbi:MAG TPA: hypothetical protein VFR86_22475 [Burkholderiaceae bacterium]|nr:hypothetical protein [Burkholderiaceae bacterium]